MNKRIIPLLALALLILTTTPLLVSGAITDNLITYYSFSGGSFADNLSHHNAVDSGTDSAVGLVGDARYCNALEDDYIDTWNLGVPGDSFGNISGAFTINFLMKFNTSGNANFMAHYVGGNDGFLFNNFESAADKIGVGVYGSSYGYISQSSADTGYRTNQWVMLTFAKPDDTIGNWRLYFNGTLLATSTGGTGSTDYTTWTKSEWLCSRNSAHTSDVTMYIDEVGFWDRNLTQEEISALWSNYSAGLGYPFNTTTPAGSGTNITASFISPTPANNSHNNTQVNITLNCSATSGTIKYYLWFDNTTGITPILVNSTNRSWITNVTQEDDYHYKGACYNGTLSDNTTGYTWYYDTTNPTLALNRSNEFNTINLSVLNQYDNWLNLSLNLTDNIGLYAMKINITTGYNETGNCMYNITNTTLGNTTSINYLQDINVTSWGSTLYYIKIMLSDMHTTTNIKDYEITTTKDTLTFNTAEGNIISIKSPESISTSTEKSTDRYSLNFEYTKLNEGETKDRTFIITSEGKGKIRQITNSPYKAHLVIWNEEEFNGNWIDFEGEEGNPEVNCEKETICIVTFRETTKETLTFNSIGGLNIASYYYSWFRGNYSLYDVNTYTSEPVNITLNITNYTGMSLINVSLIHNEVQHNSSELTITSNGLITTYQWTGTSPTTNGTINYYWLLTDIQNDSNTTTLNLSDNYINNYWNITACNTTGYNQTTIIFNISYEQIPTLNYSGNLEIDAQIWLGNYSALKQINLNFSNNWSFKICMLNETNLIITLYAKDTIEGGLTHRYYLFNQSINTTSPLTIMLYNFNDTTTTELLRITARDIDSYAYYEDIIAKLERWYIGEGVWRNVQMDRSDDYGLLIFDVVEKSQDYKIKFYDTSNNLLKTSEVLRFSCDSGVCELTALISSSGEGEESNLSVDYSYNNVTGIVNVSWNDNSGIITSVRILVTKQTITGNVYLYNITNTSSGYYLFNISNQTGMIEFNVMSTASPEKDDFTFWINRVVNKLWNIFASGKGGTNDGAFWGFVIMVVVVMIGLISPVTTIIASIVGLIAILAMGMFNAITLVGVGVIIVAGITLSIKIRK